MPSWYVIQSPPCLPSAVQLTLRSLCAVLQCEKGDSWELDPKIAERCHLMCAEVARYLSNLLWLPIIFLIIIIAIIVVVIASQQRHVSLPCLFRWHRILKPGGKYIQITFGQPHFRKRVLVKPEYNWELQTRTVGTPHKHPSVCARAGDV